METLKKKIIISPIAYIKSLMYFQRFTNEFIDKADFKLAYGLFLGYIEDEVNITDFIPVTHFNKDYLKFDKNFNSIFQRIDQLNRDYYDDEYPEYIVGWARNSLYNELEPTLVDKRNHLIFQSAVNPECFFLIFDYSDLSIGSGFNVYNFKEDFKVVNISSELIELRCDFFNDANIEDLVQLAVIIEEKRKNKEPLLKGFDEK